MSLNLSPLAVTYRRISTSCLLQYANNNKNQGRFNNVTIQSANTSIPANRMVLSCYCSFFDKMFASKTNNQVNNSVVDIPDVNGKLLELLIGYIYTGQIRIDNNNALDILAAAHHLELDEVKQFCFEFTEKFITPDNCITILNAAKQYKNVTMRDKVYKYITKIYEKITRTPAFLNLQNNELFFIIYHLKTRFQVNDEVLCRSLLNWTKQDEETRKQHLQSNLIKFVNVDQLSYRSVKDLLNESLICSISEYSYLLKTRMELLKNKGTKILSFGGRYIESSVKRVFTLDDETNTIYPDLPTPLWYSCALNVKEFIYCIGGNKIGSIISNKIFRLNLNETDMKWNEIADMNNRMHSYGAAVFNNTLVVCGGYDGKAYLSSSEAYDAELNKWNQISSLQQGRSENQSASSGGCLYTMGGHSKGIYLSSVERLDGLDQTWKSVSSMQTPRFGFAAVSCDDVIYAIGGTSDGFDVLKSVEKYDSAADKWIYVNEMNCERSSHRACVLQGKIFVVGGGNCKKKPVREIECFDPLTDRWEIVGVVNDVFDGHSIVAI